MPHRPAEEWHYTVWTAEAEEAIFDVLRLGGPDRLAAAAAGMARSTLALRRATDEDFRTRCEQAEAEWELRRLREVDTAARNGDLKATTFSLKARRPLDYADVTRLDVAMTLSEIHELQVELGREGLPVPSTTQMLRDLRKMKEGGSKRMKALPPALESLPADDKEAS